MTVTEQARRADALFYGSDSREELCRMVARRESDIEALRAELEALRAQQRKVARALGVLRRVR